MDKLDQATEQLFAEALELGADRRRAFLEDACRTEELYSLDVHFP